MMKNASGAAANRFAPALRPATPAFRETEEKRDFGGDGFVMTTSDTSAPKKDEVIADSIRGQLFRFYPIESSAIRLIT